MVVFILFWLSIGIIATIINIIPNTVLKNNNVYQRESYFHYRQSCYWCIWGKVITIIADIVAISCKKIINQMMIAIIIQINHIINGIIISHHCCEYDCYYCYHCWYCRKYLACLLPSPLLLPLSVSLFACKNKKIMLKIRENNDGVQRHPKK